MAGEELQELKLGVVRVLELVDQDVVEPILHALQDDRVCPQELQDEGDLVAEVDEAVLGEEGLVGGVGLRELLLVDLFGLEERAVLRVRGQGGELSP